MFMSYVYQLNIPGYEMKVLSKPVLYFAKVRMMASIYLPLALNVTGGQ